MFERIGRQMLELGQAQIRNGDEVRARSEPACGALGVLQPVHRLHKRIAAPLLHACDHALEVCLERARQPLEGLQARMHGPTDPTL